MSPCWTAFISRFWRPWIPLGLALVLLLASQPAPARASGALVVEHSPVVVEHLRLKVPSEARQAWLVAEQGSWEPWLKRQPGFLGRQLLWDPDRGEGILLISWASREQWKAISKADLAAVEQRFQQLAREASGTESDNPFPIVFEGELQPQ